MATAEQIELSDFIKGVHRDLRQRSKAVGADQAWQEHCKDVEKLKKYADCMKKLATIYWNHKNCEGGGSICRIGWVVAKCHEYFTHGGEALAACKELKMSSKLIGQEVMISQDKLLTGDAGSISLLDVGSCYNPFAAFPEFRVTAVDLAPATGDVLKCDFLQLKVGTENIIENGNCVELTSSSFDVVVFSLLLEYIPRPQERFLACQKAYKLMKPSGLLFILTPDSKHATANSRAMCRWRIGLAQAGFWRTFYEKSRHLHCMAFRKCRDPEVSRTWACLQKDDPGDLKDLMTIPQDFNDSENQDNVKVEEERISDLEIAECFETMPDSDYFT